MLQLISQGRNKHKYFLQMKIYFGKMLLCLLVVFNNKTDHFSAPDDTKAMDQVM